MNRRYVIPFFVFFILTSMIDCSSAEKPDNGYIASNKTEVVPNFFNINKSGKKRISNLKKPAGFKPARPQVITYGNDELKVTLYAKQFAQGNGIYAEIEKQGGSSEPEIVSISYKNINVPVTKTSWGYRCLWGIDPEEKPGNAPVSINYKLNGTAMTLDTELQIKDVDFPVSRSMLNVGKFSDKDYTTDKKYKDIIAECTALLDKAFHSVSNDCIKDTLSYPRDMHKITGDYWRKRIYLTYQKKGRKKVKVEGRKRFHRGVDLKGAVGAPVFAMADGIVVLSHTMFYEGNMVIVDHGNQVFSYYQHLDSRKVKEGDRVAAGDIIGGVGVTGMVTGPHLHVAFSIRGVHVDPLSILSLPVSR